MSLPRPDEEGRSSPRWPLILSAVAAGALPIPIALASYTSWYGMLGDEGVILNGARRVLEGQIPFRDFYSILTPGSYYLLAVWLKAFGDSLQVARGALLCTHALTVSLLLLILRNLGVSDRRQILGLAALATFGVAGWVAVSHHWFANVFLLGSLLLLLSSVEQWPAPRLFAAGLLASGTACTLQDKGAYWILAAAAALGLCPGEGRLRRVYPFAAGVGAVSLPVSAVFLWKAGLPALLEDLVVGPLTRYHSGGLNQERLGASVIKSFQNLGGAPGELWGGRRALLASANFCIGIGEVILLAVVLVAAAVLLRELLGKGGDSRRRCRVLLLGACYLSMVGTLLHHPAGAGFLWALPGSLLPALWLVPSSGRFPPALRIGWRGASVLITAALCWAALSRCILLPLTSPTQRIRFPAGTVEASAPREIATLKLAQQFGENQVRAGDRVTCYLYAPTLAYLLRLPLDTRYDLFLAPLHSAAEVEAHLLELESHPPDWILYDRQKVPGTDRVLLWINDRYRVTKVSDGLLVLERRRQLPAGQAETQP